MVLPDPVDHHASRQGIARTRNPLGQYLAATSDYALQVNRIRVSCRSPQETWLNGLSLKLHIAPLENVGSRSNRLTRPQGFHCRVSDRFVEVRKKAGCLP